MITATRREQGPPTSCHQCSEGPIRGFNVVDTDHGIHRVLCTDCAREAVEATQVTGPEEHPCDKCGVMVSELEYTGRSRPDGTTEYLCPDCPSDYCADCGSEIWYSDADAQYFHVDVERECFLTTGKTKATA